ncbi:MAG TPA: DNA primase [Hyphomicrobiaceae bacterium]|jgi:DNA primase|nr:DNA primase [Hyphomicrobiaceae bacterium]
MRFPPSLIDEIRARLPVSQVVARKVALKRAGRELKGLSPFKQEKTPSFFVNDHKGSWFDFSSGQNGDIFKFIMLTEGLSFPEAVERLAEEAGIALPKASRAEAEAEDERARLYQVLEASCRFFESQLGAGAGLEARRYLEGRGLGREASARFRLGYAPNSRSALKEHLAKAGFTGAEMVAAGMQISGEDIPVAYDRFRHRVTFPISDLKGRIIAFGARALDPDTPAKYLNSPDTPLFHKGAVLFNAANARRAAFDKARIIVVEGYMDVIALAEAGFQETVAPLGTALTENQLQVLWRLAPSPVLCFDGDAAGRNAAFRAVETVLPHLKPGHSVEFAFLPDGFDPDELVRQHGAGAMTEVLTKTRPLFDVLIDREERRGETATPEQRAAFDDRLKALVQRIADRGVREHYERELRAILWARTAKLTRAIAGRDGRASAFTAKRRNNTQLDWRVAARASERSRLGAAPRAAQLGQAPVRSNELAERSLPVPAREALLVTALLNHPWLLERHCEEVAQLPLTAPPLARLRDGMLALLSQGTPLDALHLRTQLSAIGLNGSVAIAERGITHKGDKFAEPETDAADVEAGWLHALAMHKSQTELKRHLEGLERAYAAEPSEMAFGQIVEIQQQLLKAHQTLEGQD